MQQNFSPEPTPKLYLMLSFCFLLGSFYYLWSYNFNLFKSLEFYSLFLLSIVDLLSYFLLKHKIKTTKNKKRYFFFTFLLTMLIGVFTFFKTEQKLAFFIALSCFSFINMETLLLYNKKESYFVVLITSLISYFSSQHILVNVLNLTYLPLNQVLIGMILAIFIYSFIKIANDSEQRKLIKKIIDFQKEETEQKAIRTTINSLRHHLNNSLTVTLGYLELIRIKKQNFDILDKKLETSLKNLNVIIENIIQRKEFNSDDVDHGESQTINFKKEKD